MKKETIPKAILERIEAELVSGEDLLWVGKPNLRRMLWIAPRETPNWMSWLLGAELAAFLALFFGSGARTSGWFYGIALLLLILTTLAGDIFRRYQKAEQTLYAVTNQRAMIIESDKVSSFGPDSLQQLQRRKDDLIFATKSLGRRSGYYGLGWQDGLIEEGFFGIENPEQVELLLMENFMLKVKPNKRLVLEADSDLASFEAEESGRLEELNRPDAD